LGLKLKNAIDRELFGVQETIDELKKLKHKGWKKLVYVTYVQWPKVKLVNCYQKTHSLNI